MTLSQRLIFSFSLGWQAWQVQHQLKKTGSCRNWKHETGSEWQIMVHQWIIFAGASAVLLFFGFSFSGVSSRQSASSSLTPISFMSSLYISLLSPQTNPHFLKKADRDSVMLIKQLKWGACASERRFPGLCFCNDTLVCASSFDGFTYQLLQHFNGALSEYRTRVRITFQSIQWLVIWSTLP